MAASVARPWGTDVATKNADYARSGSTGSLSDAGSTPAASISRSPCFQARFRRRLERGDIAGARRGTVLRMARSTGAIFAAVIAMAGLPSSGCHGGGTHVDGSHTDGGVGSVDAGLHVNPGPNGPNGHYAHCRTESDCPMGDSCSGPSIHPPPYDNTAPLICRPACTRDLDCLDSLSGVSLAVVCSRDHFCAGICGMGAPPCDMPYLCYLFTGFTDGYCHAAP